MENVIPIRVEDITPRHIGLFKAKLKKVGDCWEWTGCKNKEGCGVVTIGGVQYIAARIAYYLQYKVDPFPYCVLHTCDNEVCVTKAHIYRGTRVQNTADRMSRGRGNCARGEANSILSEDDVIAIRKSAKDGASIYSIHKSYSHVSYMCVSKIVRRLTWTHLP